MNDNTDKGSGGEAKKPGEWAEGLGGKGKGGAKNKGGAGKAPDGAPGEVHPIGENLGFSDGFESHSLYFEEQGTDAVLMVASKKRKITDRLGDLDKDEEGLRPVDRPKAKGLRAKARMQAKKADEPADKTAAMNLASRKAAEAHKKHGNKKGPKGKKDDAKQTNKLAVAAERALAPTMKDLLHVSAQVKFDAIRRSVKMHGGTEQVEIAAAGKKAVLKIAGKPKADALEACHRHLKNAALNKSAPDAVYAALRKVLAQLKLIEAVPVVAGQVAHVAYDDLKAAAEKIDKAVAQVGETLRIENLARSLKAPVFKPAIPVEFQISATPNARYRDKFKDEMSAQMQRQEKDLNANTVDRWVARVDTYKSKSFDWFKKLDRSARGAVAAEVSAKLKEAGEDVARRAKQLKGLDAKQERLTANAPVDEDALKRQLGNIKLEAKALEREQRRAKNLAAARLKLADFLDDNDNLQQLSPAQAKRFVQVAKKAKAVGRSGDEKLWKETHEAAIREVLALSKEEGEWNGLKVSSWKRLAPLHNPDQVAGGHGKIADITPVKKPAADADKKTLKVWQDYVDKVAAFVGPSWVNSIIGGSWGNAIEAAKKTVVKAYPPPTFPLWMMNLDLIWKQKANG